MNKKITTKTTEQGYIQVLTTEPPGCLTRADAWLRRAAWYAFAAGVGFAAGMVCRGRWFW
jgi:hypothetical protein